LTGDTVHAYADDALADHDAVALAELVRRGELSAEELASAAIARAEQVNPQLNAVAYAAYDQPLTGEGPLRGVPTYVKDNTLIAGMPTGYGTAAFPARPAKQHGRFARQYLGAGFTVLGKSRLPEFGFNATTEFADADPTRNPWHTDFSCGASSGGAAVLVASGVVPIAHANDGGGSIRIPAACCGLVGLKPSRGRLVDGEEARSMPINLIAEGVVSRSVRDTAAFFAAAEAYQKSPKLPPLGLVEGPSSRRLVIGLVTETAGDGEICAETRAVLDETAARLESLGHRVEPVGLPVGAGFVRDFTLYWGLLSHVVSRFGKRVLHPEFDPDKLDEFSRGLREIYRSNRFRTPTTLYRLSRARRGYLAMFAKHDLVLSPVLGHTTPKLGYLSPTVPFEELMDRLIRYVAFTPLNNVTGGPAISLPVGAADNGLPIGVQFSARHGDERTLLEIGFALEQDRPWRRIQLREADPVV